MSSRKNFLALKHQIWGFLVWENYSVSALLQMILAVWRFPANQLGDKKNRERLHASLPLCGSSVSTFWKLRANNLKSAEWVNDLESKCVARWVFDPQLKGIIRGLFQWCQNTQSREQIIRVKMLFRPKWYFFFFLSAACTRLKSARRWSSYRHRLVWVGRDLVAFQKFP